MQQELLTGFFKIVFCAAVIFFAGARFAFAQTGNISIKNKPAGFAQADSFFTIKDWQKAVRAYQSAGIDTSVSSLEWNRLGFSFYNTGNTEKALFAYRKSLQYQPPALLLRILLIRMARAYAKQNKYDDAIQKLDEAIKHGYSNADELDSLKEFNTIRQREDFKKLRDNVFAAAYPCAAEQHSRDFDFWVGEWIVYVTGTNTLAGYSIIQKASGECMILENWTSANNSYNGKSINYYEPSTGKWEQVWVGSEGGSDRAHHFYNGEYNNNAMHFEFVNKDSSGNEQPGRFTFYNQGKNQVRQLNEISIDGGKTWQTVYDFTYFRKEH